MPMTKGSRCQTCPHRLLTVTPAATSPTTSPSSTTGTTLRTDGPSVPVNSSVTVPPAAASAIVPR